MSIKGPLFEMLNGRNPDILECPPHRFLCEDKAAGRLAGHQHSRCSPLLMGWSSRVTFAAPAHSRFRHSANILVALKNVRFWGESGHGDFIASMSAFDPKRTSTLFRKVRP
jgi:hypothetical protein